MANWYQYRLACLVLMGCAAVVPDLALAESRHVFGIHGWGRGANVDVMSHETGWLVEYALSRESPNLIGRIGPGDLDDDGDVDIEDFGLFQTCYSGPGVTQTLTACYFARLDDDDDVDHDDFGIFQRCLSGPNTPADPNCAD